MNNKVGNFIAWILFILIFLSPCLMEYSYVLEDMQINPYDYARITDVEYTGIVLDDGEATMLVQERITFDVHAASKNNLFWELWRDLPEDYVDGVKVDYTVHSVKQILEDGTEIIYEESPKLYWDDYDYVKENTIYGPGKWYHSEGPYDELEEQYECVFFYVDGLYREEVVFEIVYEMHNAALRYGDCSDLYISLYSGSTVKHLESFKADILLPNKDMPAPGNYEIYTYGTNSNEFPVTESDTKYPGYHTFSFSLDEDDLKFKPYNQDIEFDLVSYGADKHVFTDNAPLNSYYNDVALDEIRDEWQYYINAPTIYATIKWVIWLAAIALGAYILYRNFTVGRRMKFRHVFYEPTTQMDYYREIPSDLDPNFATALVFCKENSPKDDSGVYSAILLSLARKEYIELQEIGYDDVQIVIKKAPVQPVVAPPSPMLSPLIQPSIVQPSIVKPAVVQSPMEQNPMMANPMAQPPVSTIYDDTDSINRTIDVTGTPIQPAIMPELQPEPVIPEKIYEPLTLCEQHYFNLIVRHAVGGSITMKSFQHRVSTDYYNTDSFVRNMESSIVNIGIKEGYLQKVNYTQPKEEMRSSAKTLLIFGILLITLVNIISYNTRLDLAFGAFFILGASCIISSVYLKKESVKYVLLTQLGEDEYVKWRGLYNFLNSDTLIHERTFIELPIWEKYLIYASAFGLSEKVINAISISCPEASHSVILNNNYCRSGRIHHSSRSFRSSVRSGSSIARGGGGYGYGGGGRGGGGGGGGH